MNRDPQEKPIKAPRPETIPVHVPEPIEVPDQPVKAPREPVPA